jgi:hypothetical protein
MVVAQSHGDICLREQCGLRVARGSAVSTTSAAVHGSRDQRFFVM